MAAVQDLFRRLKLRRSMNKRSKSKDSLDAPASSPRLGDRVGVELPPVPPPGFNLNLPDISRDCVHSPTPHDYDEIPAYAIDTRLDVLRDAYWERKGMKPEDMQRNVSNVNVSSQNGFRYPHEHGQGQWQREHAPQRHYSLPRDQYGNDSGRYLEEPRIPRRRGTPWHRGYESDCDDAGSPDQLDQWVSVQESLHALSTEDVRMNQGRRDVQHPPQQRPWYEDETHTDNHPNRQVERSYHSSVEHIPTINQHFHPIQSTTTQDRERVPSTIRTDTTKYPSPTPGSMSDDSGVSSPSNRESRPWGKKNVPRLFHSGQYSDSDSSTYCGNPGKSQDMTSHRAHLDISCEGSSDTYNEYDHHNSSFSEFGSLSRDHRVNESSMSPQEYMFYLGKIQNNFTKSHDVRQLATGSHTNDSVDSHFNVTGDSFDLTSVTSLSEISTLSEEELHQLTREFEANTRVRPSSAPRKMEAKVAQTKPATSRQVSTNQSAFKPYSSQRRHSHTSESTPEPNTSQPQTVPTAMSLEDKLSCRVTSNSARPSAALQKINKPQTPSTTQRPFPAVQPQARRSAQNMLLSDIMRINHDRQILGML